MADTWWIRDGEASRGPLSAADFAAEASSGAIREWTQVKKSVDGPWFPAGDVMGVLFAPRPGESRSLGESSATSTASESGPREHYFPDVDPDGAHSRASHVKLERRMWAAGSFTFVILAVGVLFLARDVFRGYDFAQGSPIERQLAAAAAAQNRSLPKQLTPNISWTRVVAGPGLRYSMIFLVSADLSTDEQVEIHDKLTTQMTAAGEMKRLMDKGVTLTFIFEDDAGHEVFSFNGTLK